MLFFLPIILVDYSQEVSLLFQLGVPIIQFRGVTFILKRQFICGCYYSIKKWNIILYSAEFAFVRKSFFQKRKYKIEI